MPDSLQPITKTIDTVFIQGQRFYEGLKVKDTGITITVPAEKPVQSFWDYGAVQILIPTFVALFAIWLGNKLSNDGKNKDRRSKLEKLKKSLEIWALQSETLVIILNSHLEKFVKDVQDQKNIETITLTQVHTLIETLSESDLEKYQSYTIINLEGDIDKNSSNSYFLRQHIKFLTNAEMMISEGYKNYQDAITKLVDRWNEGNGMLSELIVELLQEVESNKEHVATSFTNKLFALVPLQAADDMDTWFEKFCMPVHQLIYTELNTNHNNSYPGRLLKAMSKLRLTYLNWHTLKINVSTELGDLAKSYITAYKDLKTEIEILKKQKIKKIVV